jgi:hypothetical protein
MIHPMWSIYFNYSLEIIVKEAINSFPLTGLNSQSTKKYNSLNLYWGSEFYDIKSLRFALVLEAVIWVWREESKWAFCS